MNKASLWLVSFVFFLIASCGNKETPILTPKNDLYGSTFRFCVPYMPPSLFPPEANSLYEQQITSLIYEPLFRLGSNDSIEGLIASGFAYSKDNSSLIINIKPNVFFHEHSVFQGGSRRLNANDVAFSIAFSCSSHPKNKNASLFQNKIKGVDKYLLQSSEKINPASFEGVRILNDSTVEVFLENTKNQIINVLSHPSVSMLSFRAYLDLGDRFFTEYIGTGAFCKPFFQENKLTLQRNAAYHFVDEFNNTLPYLDGVEVFVDVDPVTAFEKGQINLLQNIAPEDIGSLFGSLEGAQKGNTLLHRTYVLKDKEISFLLFNESLDPFKKTEARQKVRQTLAQSLDFYALFDGAVRSDTSALFFVPNPFSSFSLDTFVFAHSDNNSLNDSILVSSILNTLSKKNFIFRSKKMTLEELVAGGFSGPNMVKINWIPDYSDIDSFLGLFYSKSSFAKTFHINDAVYDSLYLNSLNSFATDENQQKAKQWLLSQAHCVPLFSKDIIYIANINMRGVEISSTGLFNLSKAYWKPVKPL